MNTAVVRTGSVDLDVLLSVAETPRVSVVIPVTDPQQDAIRGRGLIDQVRSHLDERETPEPADFGIADALDEMVVGMHPMSRSIGAVALYAAPGFRRLVRLNHRWPESISVGAEFKILPVVDADDPAHCFALTLSRSGANLWRVTRYGIESIELVGAPRALTDVTRFREMEKQLQYHATARGGAVMFHGHQESADREFEPIRTYLRGVDRAVLSAIGADDAPVLLIGPGNLPALYREVTDLGSIVAEPVESHPDGLGDADIHWHAATVVNEIVATRTKTLTERAGALQSTRRASSDAAEILVAATEGRIDTVLFDPIAAEDPAANRAAVDTLRRGGSVVPAPGLFEPVMAIYRY